jgi:hypothetical protein
MAKKITQAQRIRDYFTKNPGKTVPEAAKAMGIKYQIVYMTKRDMDKRLSELAYQIGKGRTPEQEWKTVHISTSDNSIEAAIGREIATTIRELEIPITMEEPKTERVEDHPLYAVFYAAIEQAMFGKGERHGGARTPFLEQPWAHYVKLHGRGFATGQAAKKLEEAATTRTGVPFEQEVFGAMVYLGMAVLEDRRREAELKS